MPPRARTLALLLLLLPGCSPGAPDGPPAPDGPLAALPVDSVLIGSPDAVARWAYRRDAPGDLDGDGRPERVVVAADVAVDAAGLPLWEDGHRWSVFVVAPDGPSTVLYAAFVPNGFAEVAVLAPDDRGRRHVLVRERTPAAARDLEVEYRGPGAAGVADSVRYRVEAWLAGPADGPAAPPRRGG